MKTVRVIISTILAILTHGLLLAQSLYVSPQGSDEAPGTVQKPLATLQRAVALAANAPKITEIVLREGTYYLDRTITVERSNLTIKASKGELPIISGGKTLTGVWQKDGRERWKMKVPSYFRQLFVNGQRATRARFPNAGAWSDQWYQPDSIDLARKRIVLNYPIPPQFASIKNAEMHATAWWHWLRQKVARFDPGSQSFYTVTEPSPGVSGRKMDLVDRIHFENDIAFLDTENEWFVDSLTKTLYYQSAHDPAGKAFAYPTLERLIQFKGTAEKPLKDIRLEGLKFVNTVWNMPDTERKGIQAGFWGTDHGKPVFAPPAAVMLFWVDGGAILNCQFENLGEGAIALSDGCRNNRIEANDFYDIGSNVIQIGWRTNYVGKGKSYNKGENQHPLYFAYDDPRAIPSHNVVHNNHLNKFCTTDRGGVGVWVGYSDHNEITHNLLENFTYTGISVGWRWDTLPNPTMHNLIEWNEVRNGMQYLSDGGGIYTAGRQEGTKILNNWVHGISGGPVLGEGIYNDEGGSYFEIANNYVERIKSLSVKFHQNLWSSIDAHDNNGVAGKQEVIFPERKTVGSLDMEDATPQNPSRYGLIKK